MSPIDYTNHRYCQKWLHHPVVGDVSFDAFKRLPGNPVHIGQPPWEWPVNGFLFRDPVSTRWYLYIGRYRSGYNLQPPANGTDCWLLRSDNDRRSWTTIGSVFPDQPHVYEDEESPIGLAPDVSVVYHEGRYHMVFDWISANSTWADAVNPGPGQNNGLGYAWADTPEGPFHHIARPIYTTRSQQPLLGRYRRGYAATLIRRASDWMVLFMMDNAPHAWALCAITASDPTGPWSPPTLLLYPDMKQHHPALMEFYPAFTHAGHVWAPATSVAANRNYQALFTAPIEQAHSPDAWKLHQSGSLWHSEPVPHEYHGIWGQTFSGQVCPDDRFAVMFPSRTADNLGTINLAERRWSQPLRESGFVMSAHNVPSVAPLQQAWRTVAIQTDVKLHGTVGLFWGAQGPLGPDRYTSDAHPHPLCLAERFILWLTETDWQLVRTNRLAEASVLQAGRCERSAISNLAISHRRDGAIRIIYNSRLLWAGVFPHQQGFVGWALQPRSHLECLRFRVDGEPIRLAQELLYTDAILGAGQSERQWSTVTDSLFRWGSGAVSTGASSAAKWNFYGTGCTLYCPRGPQYGRMLIYMDGQPAGSVDLQANAPVASQAVFRRLGMKPGHHALWLSAAEKPVPIDTLQVWNT